jgi:hypothetical protein
MFSNMTKVDLRENPLVEKPIHWKVNLENKIFKKKNLYFLGFRIY